MAKKLVKLSVQDIVLQADAETIREAYEARLKIDELLVKREEAYRQIEAIELQVEELVGEDGLFVYPEPPLPVAGFSKLTPSARPKPKVVPPPETQPEETPAEDADATPENEPATEDKPAAKAADSKKD
jgi:hypothetical protein